MGGTWCFGSSSFSTSGVPLLHRSSRDDRGTGDTSGEDEGPERSGGSEEAEEPMEKGEEGRETPDGDANAAGGGRRGGGGP